MPLQFGIWAPVCGGWLRVNGHETDVSIQHLVEVAKQADQLGYDFFYIPEHYLNAIHGPSYEVADAWITAAVAGLETKRINIVTAVQPGFKLPTVVAKLGSSVQNQVSSGRFGLSGIAGWWQLEVESYGDVWLAHQQRYARLAEYLDVIFGMWTEDVLDYQGEYYNVSGGVLPGKPNPIPFLFIAGESDAAIDLAARKADYLFINADSLERTAAFVERAKQLASDRYNRKLKIAMSAFAIVGRTTAEAETRLEQIYRTADLEQIYYFQAQMDANVIAHNKLDLAQTIEANLGLSAQLIGDAETVIERLKAFEAVGIDLVMLKFESMLMDTRNFHESIISNYQQRNLISL
jgi:FMNH2-dependent dimethyl sulfone monooxygenase